MRAIVYDAFRSTPQLDTVPDPTPTPDGVVVRVDATGVCRSDWHGWQGHDPDITLPHVPGHELAGVIEAVGHEVKRWVPGQRVTVPFVSGCGQCEPCSLAQPQVCHHQYQPGFTGWGSLAEFVALRYADRNLVALPEAVDAVSAASLGCRFATSFRGIVEQGRVQAGEWVVIHGCGGVGLSAIMIARAAGAHVIAVDIRPEPLALALTLGAVATLRADQEDDVVGALHDLTGGGAHLSMDAVGHPETCFASIACLRTQGRHVQVGLLLADASPTPVPMDQVIARELTLLGVHGLAPPSYNAMLRMIAQGHLDPGALVTQRLSLAEAPEVLERMGAYDTLGCAVIVL